MTDIFRRRIRALPVRRGGALLFGAGLFGAVMLALALSVAAPATPVAAEAPAAARLNDGIAAWDAGDYDSAAAILKPLADAGDPQAQERMAVLYIRGLGVTPDNAIANHYLHLAADAGNAAAQSTLGMRYLYGERGITKDEKTGLAFLRMAAQENHVVALTTLGLHFSKPSSLEGRGDKPDLETSHDLYRRAAAAGFPSAQKFLGLLYLNKSYAGKDLEKGFMWLAISKINGSAEEAEAFSGIKDVIKDEMSLFEYAWFYARHRALVTRCLESDYEDCG